ncbi:hypothetical protein SNEBB_005555 [Seison nebaliae]|nr:hypothetical protein SNEBB_005555 [Seison nebaliae]
MANVDEVRKFSDIKPDNGQNLKMMVEEESSCSRKMIIGATGAFVFYPFKYAKTLIQIGFEPLPVMKSYNLFHTNKYWYYPNIIRYMRHMVRVDGLRGMYCGVMMDMCSTALDSYVASKAEKWLEKSKKNDKIRINNDIDGMEVSPMTMKDALEKISESVVIRIACSIATHPLNVMVWRCMGQFVGGERIYSPWNVFSNVEAIYRNDGLTGMFSGIIPVILWEVSTVTLTNLLLFILQNQIPKGNLSAVCPSIAGFISHGITYPLQMISRCMAINGSGLAAGAPPNMPLYINWYSCLLHCYSLGELKRGNKFFYREFNPANAVAKA